MSDRIITFSGAVVPLFIPIELCDNKNLTLTEKLLFTKIHYLDGPDGCYAKNDYFAKFLEVSAQTISVGISKLKKMGLIKEVAFTGRNRILKSMVAIRISDGSLKNILRLSNIDNNISSKEDYAHSVGTGDIKQSIRTIKPPRISEYVEYWNSLKGTRKHKDTESKVYKECRKKIRQLMKGELSNVQFDKEWVKKNNIRNIKKPWTEALIYKGMDRLALLFKEGYWPEDKSWLPRSLPDLIYNPMTQKSWFLWVMCNGNPELHETREHKNGAAGIMAGKLKWALLRCRGEGSKLKPGEFPALKDKADQMFKFYRLNEKEDFRYHFPNVFEFAKDYALRFIDKYENNSNLVISWIGPGGLFWDTYIRQLEDEMGVELKGKKE